MTIIHVPTTITELKERESRHESLWWNGEAIWWNAERRSPDCWCLITAEKARMVLAGRQKPDNEEQPLGIGILTRETPDAKAIWTDPHVDVVAVIGTSISDDRREFTFGPLSDQTQRHELWIDLAARVTAAGWNITSRVNVTYRQWTDAIMVLDIVGEPLNDLFILEMTSS